MITSALPIILKPSALDALGLVVTRWRKLFALVMFMVCLGGCAHPEPTLVVVVGGLGFSQLGDLRHAVAEKCPQATVVSAGGWDGYKTDVKALATAKPHQ